MPHVFAYDHRHDLPLTELALVIGGKAANIATMADGAGPPRPAGVHDHDRGLQRVPGGRLAGRARRRDPRAHGAAGGAGRPALRRPGRPAPRERPVRGATVDARDDGHDPQPRPQPTRPRPGLAAASGDPAFARDCHDRFHKIYRDVVGVRRRPEDPWDQLRGAIEAVFRSWNSDRARAYREHEGISDDPGHRRHGPGDGVRQPRRRTPARASCSPATRRPARTPSTATSCSTPRARTWSPGRTETEPISCLDDRMPAVAAELRRYAAVLERHYRDCCDIEFTIEQGRLWMLQVRVGKRTPQAALRMALEMAEDPDVPAQPRARPCAASPRSSPTRRRPSPSAPTRARCSRPGCPRRRASPAARSASPRRRRSPPPTPGGDAILVRAETSPDDVHGMSRARGILTTTGGLRQPRGGGRPGLGHPRRRRGVRRGARRRDGHDRRRGRWRPGDHHDRRRDRRGLRGRGRRGRQVVPEAGSSLAWARELGITIAGEPAPVETTAGTSGMAADEESSHDDVTADDAVRVLAIKGYCDPAGHGRRAGLRRRRGRRATGPARRRGPGGAGRGLVPAHRGRQGGRSGAPGRGRRPLGRPRQPTLRWTRSSRSTTG